MNEVPDWFSAGAVLATVGLAFLLGAAPVFVIRLISRIYPKGDERRAELVAEVAQIKGFVKTFELWRWLGESFAVAVCEGIPARHARRTSDPEAPTPPSSEVQNAYPDTLSGRAANSFLAYRGGEAAAIGRLVDELTPVLWHTAKGLGLDGESADYVVQDTWLRLVANAGRISEPGMVMEWLMGTLRHETSKMQARLGPPEGQEQH